MELHRLGNGFNTTVILALFLRAVDMKREAGQVELGQWSRERLV